MPAKTGDGERTPFCGIQRVGRLRRSRNRPLVLASPALPPPSVHHPDMRRITKALEIPLITVASGRTKRKKMTRERTRGAFSRVVAHRGGFGELPACVRKHYYYYRSRISLLGRCIYTSMCSKCSV